MVRNVDSVLVRSEGGICIRAPREGQRARRHTWLRVLDAAGRHSGRRSLPPGPTGLEMRRVGGAAVEHLKQGFLSQSHPPPGGLAPTAGTECDGGLAWAEGRSPPSGGLRSVCSLQ